MSCKQLVVAVLAISGCRDRCELRSSPPAPASTAIEAMTEEPPGQSAGQAAEPAEPPEPDRPPPPPLPRAQLAPATVEPRRPVMEAPPRPQVAREQPSPPPPPPPQEPYRAPAPAPKTYVEVHVPPAPVQVMPTTQPQYNDAGVLVPAVPLWIDPSAPPGMPGNGAPDPKTTGER